MKSFEIVDDAGLADIRTVAAFTLVAPARIRQLVRRQWQHNSKHSVAVACDRVSGRLLYSAYDILAVTRRPKQETDAA